jgi:choline dehydrogenase-like flavoprotein
LYIHILAAELAAAGHRVIVVEKAKYAHHTEQTYNELDSFSTYFERNGTLQAEDGSMQILAGTAWGGGTHVNWCASLRPPASVREEWAEKYSLPYFTSTAYQQALDAVCARAGVSEENITHSPSNEILLNGAKKVGYPVSVIPQNTKGANHNCGWCTFGCPYAEKQGTHRTWLQDAAEHGAKFIVDCKVEKITQRNGKVTGIVGKVDDNTQPIIIKAKTVVSSCGSVNTPALLLRSGLRNSNIGKNLRLHPVTTVYGFFPNREINPFSNAIMTTVCDATANIHGNGYGSRLEIAASQPGMMASTVPWRNAEDYKRIMIQFPRTINMIVLTRDFDSVASVTIDSKGDARVYYRVGPKDAISLTEGIIASAKIMLSQGAVEINNTQLGTPALILDKEDLADPLNAPKVKEWIKLVRAKSARQNQISLFCAHQMGSCRMGATPAMGAVNPDGESWEVKGLYVADASLFPTASGVK